MKSMSNRMQGSGEMRGDQELTPHPLSCGSVKGPKSKWRDWERSCPAGMEWKLAQLFHKINNKQAVFSKKKDALAESSAILLLEICFKESSVGCIRRQGGDYL